MIFAQSDVERRIRSIHTLNDDSQPLRKRVQAALQLSRDGTGAEEQLAEDALMMEFHRVESQKHSLQRTNLIMMVALFAVAVINLYP